MEIAISVVIPSADRVDESRVVELTEKLCQVFLWRTISLTPCLIVNDLLRSVYLPSHIKDLISYPSRDRRIALVLVDQNLKLSPELSLLRIIWFPVASWETRHVLNNEKTELVTGLIEKMRLIFDL